jgi:hypothetical protein
VEKIKFKMKNKEKRKVHNKFNNLILICFREILTSRTLKKKKNYLSGRMTDHPFRHLIFGPNIGEKPFQKYLMHV